MIRSNERSAETNSNLRRLPKHWGRTIAAGCVIGVTHESMYVQRVFLDATHLVDLVDNPHIEGLAANIVVHELAHVSLDHWQIKPPWDYVSLTLNLDWRYEVLRYLTLNFWDEYAACRLNALFGAPVLLPTISPDASGSRLNACQLCGFTTEEIGGRSELQGHSSRRWPMRGNRSSAPPT